MSIADRALAAYEAEQEAARLEKEAKEVRGKSEAAQAISEEASRLGIPVDASQITGSIGLGWKIEAPIDADTSIEFSYRSSRYDPPETELKMRVCDQLYWDLPPGEEIKTRGGGSYGCYNLSGVQGKRVGTLAEIGEAVKRVREARESWRKKHLV